MKTGHRVSIPNFILNQSPLIAIVQCHILHHFSTFCKIGIHVFGIVFMPCGFLSAMIQ